MLKLLYPLGLSLFLGACVLDPQGTRPEAVFLEIQAYQFQDDTLYALAPEYNQVQPQDTLAFEVLFKRGAQDIEAPAMLLQWTVNGKLRGQGLAMSIPIVDTVSVYRVQFRAIDPLGDTAQAERTFYVRPRTAE